MRQARIVFVAALAAWMLGSGVAGAQGAIKLGGGMHFDEHLPGVCASIDIPFGSNYAISPFAEVFYKTNDSVAGVGLNLMVKRPSGDRTWMYVGAGGGLGRVRSQRVGELTIDGQVISETLKASKQQLMADAVIGIEYASTERASIFVQGKWIGMFGGGGTQVLTSTGETEVVHLDVKAFAVQVGIALHLGEREGEFDY